MNPNWLHSLSGSIEIVGNLWATRVVHHVVPRTWRDRWTTWPWRPWRPWTTHKRVSHEIPDWSSTFYMPGPPARIFCHPKVAKFIKSQVQELRVRPS